MLLVLQRFLYGWKLKIKIKVAKLGQAFSKMLNFTYIKHLVIRAHRVVRASVVSIHHHFEFRELLGSMVA